ncbi:MAG: VanZ family protein, partial [Candidatus Eremiobacteraeota bacterium]|nr:VanZ family protein [Candidatus Eremiobacteraeota bacterium]
WIATARATAAGGKLRREVLIAGGVGLLLGLMAETAQLFSPIRMSSILDVLTNGLGALLGAAVLANAIAYAARDAWRRARHRTRPTWLARLGNPPLLYVAASYTAACWLEAFSPLGRPDRVPGAWGGPRRSWAAAVAYARTHANTLPSWSDPLLFAPVGAFVTLWLMERGMRRWSAALLTAGALAVGWAAAELLRGVSGGDMLGWAVVVHALASAVGAIAAAAWTGRVEHGRSLHGHSHHGHSHHGRVSHRQETRGHASLRRYALPAFAALLVLWSWRPFIPVTSWTAVRHALTPEAFTPLAQLAALMPVHSVADVGVGALLYAPLGAWLAGRATPSDNLFHALWPGFAVAVVAEFGQLVIATRTFDITDALVQCAGVLVGAVVWRAAQARIRTHGPAARVHGTVLRSPQGRVHGNGQRAGRRTAHETYIPAGPRAR